MKSIAILSLLAASLAPCFGGTTTGTNSGDPIVALPPFHVDEFSSYLGFTWNATLKEDKIASVRFSRVDPRSLAERAGLMPNDHLTAIDGHAVLGLPLSGLQQLFARNWKPGDTLTWGLTIERGAVFTRQHTITLRMKTKAPEASDATEPPAAAPAK